MPIHSSFQAPLAELKADHASGATTLAKLAATLFVQLTDTQLELPDTELAAQCTELALAVLRSQPTMAPLLNLCNRVLVTVRTAGRPEEVRERIRSMAGGFVSQLETSTTRIALHAEPMIEEGMTIFTHSHSSAVKKTLVKAHEAGRSFSVICTESRPIFEGTDLARELAGLDIPVTLIADAAAFSILQEADMAMVGSDSVSQGGVVNKIGTSGLAVAAQRMKVPFYVLCGSEKFIPDRLVMIEPTKAVEELLSPPVPGVAVRNFYFDTTPLEELTALITEEGMQTIADVRRYLSVLEENFVLRPEDLVPSP